MAGTIPLSMTQQFNEYGEPLAGGQLYLIQAGTVSTPQNGYQEPSLTTPLPNPITLDAAGRIPQFFLADGFIKIRLQDKHGVVQLASDGIQVVGPSSGGGGGGGLAGDATQLMQPGNIIARYGTGAFAGWVRCNGLTIGSATSSPPGSERANADCQVLFEYLWNDATLVISGGRGSSAHNDWLANKNIALPDLRGRVIAGLDGMGGGAASRLQLYGANSDILGSPGGQQTSTLLTANLPAYTPAGSISNGAITTTISPSSNILSSTGLVQVGGGGSFFSYNLNSLSASSSQAASSFSGYAQGGASTPVSILQPMMLMTHYIKL